jgi:2,4-dienoyl-CoA reductase-like NADH-dependent reductase (Old Yellow Enzyme family)
MKSATVTSSGRLVFFLGVNTGLVTAGAPDYRYVDFYRKRSSPHLHCAIVGNVVVPGGYASNDRTPTLSSDLVWVDLADSIRMCGSRPGIQLATAWAGYTGPKKFLSTKWHEVIGEARQLVTSLGREGMAEVLDTFDEAAKIAVGHGFEHVQVHAAHGYLPSLMIDRRINPDASRAIERLALLGDRLRRERIETSIRVSLKTGDPDFDRTGSEAFLDEMAALPFDFVDLSSGFYNINKQLIYPAVPTILEARLRETLEVARRHPGRAFILSGRATKHRTSNLPSNIHLGICRDLIANPRFLSERENGCRNHGKCHYYSRGSDHVTCPRWEETDEGTNPNRLAQD